MNKKTKKMSLYIGSPPPEPPLYPIDAVDILINIAQIDIEKANIEWKKRCKIHKKQMDEYYIERKKELKELDKMLKKEKRNEL